MNVDEFQKHDSIRRFAMAELPVMIEERLRDISPAEVYSREILKNNGKVLLGITVVVKDSDMAPCIYVESYLPPDPSEFLRQGVWEDVADRMASDFRYALDMMEPDPEILFRTEDIPEKLVLDVINRDKNRKLLENFPYREYLDLAVLMKWEVVCGGRTGRIPITNEILKDWGRTFDELYDIALQNTMRKNPQRLAPLNEVLEQLSQGVLQDVESPFYYVSTERGLQGAVAILYPGLLKELYEKLQDVYYLIPSSINELLALPKNLGPDHGRLMELIGDVNSNMLDQTEILSDSLYIYVPESDQLKIVRMDDLSSAEEG